MLYVGFAKVLLTAIKICKEEQNRLFNTKTPMNCYNGKLELITMNNKLDYWLTKIMVINNSLSNDCQKSREWYKDEILKRTKESIYPMEYSAKQILNGIGYNAKS